MMFPSIASTQSDIGSIERDSRELAKMKGISTLEATRRINLQNKFNVYLQEFKEDSFISGDIESTATVFKLHVRTSRGGVGALLSSRLITDPLLFPSIQIETAPFTPEQLHAAREAVLPLLKFRDVAFRVDADTGKLVIQVKDVESAVSLVSQLRLRNIISVERRDKFPLPVADLKGYWGGGLSLVNTGSGTRCTTGFTVKKGGVKELLTAGHCVLPAMNAPFAGAGALVDGSISMVFQSAIWSGSQDFAWLYTSVTSSTNEIYDGIGSRTMTGGYYTSGSANRVANGTLLCKYGRSSGYTCQEVTNNNYTAVDGAGNRIGPLVQLGGTAANIAQCGDSGGPVFSGSIGYGVISRGDVNGTCAGGSILLYAPLNRNTPISI